MHDLRIVFMGTPEFAVASLDALVKGGYSVLAAVTAPDKPSGRGRKLGISAVKSYAMKHKIPLLQPENLKDPAFIENLQALNANLFIVVAFRMLPEIVWQMPVLGTFNLHASLLPQYRGAAPINHAIINGEKKGGVTTFFLQHEIDTGNIILRRETDIGPEETAGEYHNRLMQLGAELTIETAKAIREGKVETKHQAQFMQEGEILKKAPKIQKDDCRIDWNKNAVDILNHIRGLSPYPGAFTELKLAEGRVLYLKIFRAKTAECSRIGPSGSIDSDFKNYLNIYCRDACISLMELQQAGKKRMPVKEFLLGLNINYL